MPPQQPLLHLTRLLRVRLLGVTGDYPRAGRNDGRTAAPHWRRFVSVSDATIRTLIEETYGDHLSSDEIETLLPYIRRQFESSQKLSELDLGELDPRGMNFISDRRITP